MDCLFFVAALLFACLCRRDEVKEVVILEALKIRKALLDYILRAIRNLGWRERIFNF